MMGGKRRKSRAAQYWFDTDHNWMRRERPDYIHSTVSEAGAGIEANYILPLLVHA